MEDGCGDSTCDSAVARRDVYLELMEVTSSALKKI
jgi:hypothetical protein